MTLFAMVAFLAALISIFVTSANGTLYFGAIEMQNVDKDNMKRSIEGLQKAPDMAIVELIAKAYDEAPPVMRRRVLEHLLRPLGILSIVGVANGAFARVCDRAGWSDFSIRVEDTHKIESSHVLALAAYVQQFSDKAFHGLLQVFGSSPALASSATAALLVAILLRHANSQASLDDEDL
jgi:hypothetical protein